jgi:apolipoprotein N-acyltransferase
MPNSAYQAGIVFYFAGLVNGRFSSMFIEWLLVRKLKWIKFAPYSDFVEAEKTDSKITTLSRENNTYRAYISVCFLSILCWVYRLITDCPDVKVIVGVSLLLLSLLVLFVLSYRKQTNYVRRRVEKVISSSH